MAMGFFKTPAHFYCPENKKGKIGLGPLFRAN
jgi:hypothetical protein